MKSVFKSKLLAIALALAVAAPLTMASAVVTPTPAEAGVISSVKGAAKKVGGAVKTTAKGIGAAAKAGAAMGRQVGVGVASDVKRGTVAAGKGIAKYTPIGTVAKEIGSGAKAAAKGIKKTLFRPKK